MTDYTTDTPNLGRDWCPECEPGADPTREILSTLRCKSHTLTVTGADDDAVRDQEYVGGTGEAGGSANRILCDLIHRLQR